MAHFSTSDAAVKAFMVMGERPKPVIVWAVLYAVISVILAATNAQIAGPVLNAMENGGGDLGELFALTPWFLFGAIIFFVAWVIGYTAMIRAVLRPEDDRLFYLRAGKDEVRQGVLMLLFTLLLFGVYFILIVASLGLVFATAGGAKPANGAAMLVIIPLLLATVAGVVFVGTRLSLAMPMTFVTGKVDLTGSWALTRKRFWPILGAYFLAAVAACLIYMVGMIAVAMIGFFAGGGISGLMAMFTTTPISAADVLGPLPLTLEIVSAALTTVITFITAAPAADIYRQITAEEGAVEAP